MKEIRIADRHIGEGRPCFIIAEIGTAHQGDLRAARSLVEAAAASGADAVKTQVVFADEIVHPRAGRIDLPGGSVSLHDRFRELEAGADFYRELKACVEKAGLVFLASAFGVKSARLLRELGAPAVKIASPELNHFPLLEEVGTYGLPVILSTGVSCLGDIEEALGRLSEETALLHCVTAYPAPEEEYNLRLIPLFARLFGRPVGVSDHSRDPLLVPVAAAIQGAAVIEKHFTLRRDAGGLDDAFALDPKDFRSMALTVRRAEKHGPTAATRNLIQLYGEERVEKVFGDGRKRLAASEAGHYSTTRRSILAAKDIARGDKFTMENLALLRSEKNLAPGLHPRYLSVALGRPAKRDLVSGAGITWEDI